MPTSTNAPFDFEDFFRTQQRSLSRFVASRVSNAQDAQDIVAEVVYQTMRGMRNSDGPIVHPRAYLYRIARTHIADFYRTRSAQREVPIEEAPELPSTVSLTREIEVAEELRTVRVALGELREEYREIITLHAIVGLEITEIAEMMGKRPATVRVLLFRARRSLRKALEQSSTQELGSDSAEQG